MEIIEINSYTDFLSLESEWHNVLQSSDHTIFSTWEWLSIGWKHFGTGKKLLILLAEENGRIIGIAPLAYSVETMFGLRKKKVEFIGTGYSDYNDFILTREKPSECINSFINYLKKAPERWDCIDLIDIPETSKNSQIIEKVALNTKRIHECHYLTLPSSYDLFIRSLGSRTRKNLRRAQNLNTEFVDSSGTDSYEEGMNTFFSLHQKRWESRGLSGIFSDQRARSFGLDIAGSFSKKGWLGLFLLKLSGIPMGALYGFKYGNKFYNYLTGFDPEYSRYSVGTILCSNVIAKCIQDGLKEFDFVRGAEEYKRRWKTQTCWNRESILIRAGSLAKFENLLYDNYWRQGSRLKYFLNIHK